MKGHALNPLNFSSCVNVEKSVSGDINPCQCVMLAVGFVVGYLQYILTVLRLTSFIFPVSQLNCVFV